MSRRNPQPYLEAKVTLRGGDCQYADYWPGRTPGEIVKELGVTLREVELISAEKGKGWVRIYPRARKNPSQTWKVSVIVHPRKVSKGRKKPYPGLRQADLQVSATNLPEAVKKAETAIAKKLGASDISLLLAEEWPDKSAMFELYGRALPVYSRSSGRHLKGKTFSGAAFIDATPVIIAKAKKNAYRHSDLQHVHDYDFPVGRKNARRGAIPAIGRGEKHGYAPEGSLRRKERSIDEISEVVANMKKSPGALRPFEQRKKARKKGQTRIVRPKGNPVEYLTPSEYIKGLDAGLFKVDDPRIKVLSKKKPRHATPKEAYADGFSAARSAWHSGQHGFSDIGYWILKNAKDGSLFEERSTFGDEYRRGAKEYWLARRDAESRRTGWESSDWLERGLNNPLHPKPGIPTVWAEYRDDPDDPDDEIRLVCKVVGGRGMGRVRRNPSVKVGNKIRTSRGEEGEVTEIRGTWGYVAGNLEGWFPLSSLSQMRVLNNPDWKALGQKTKRGAKKGWKATKHAGKVAAWQAKGAALKTELADLRRCAKNLGYDDYKSGPAYKAAQGRLSAWEKQRPVKQNPVWVSPEGTAGYLSGESHTRYKKKHPQRGLVPKFMERQVRLETPLQDPPSGYRILEFEVTERGRPVTHFRIYEGTRDTGKYARDWNKAVQIAHKLAKRGREALKAAANNPRGRRDMTMLIGEDGAEWAKWSQNREGIIHRNPQVLYFPGKGTRGSGPRGGYSPAERAELPRGAFLKPGSRSWPVSDKEHAKIALQYMTRGFGNRSEYPLLLQRLAGFWPVDQNPDIWAKYRQYQPDIEEKCRCRLPTVEELRDVGPSPRDWPPVRKNKGTQRRRRRTTHWYK